MRGALAALFCLAAALGLAGDAPQERVIAALSQNRIAITAGFDGSEIFVYGAIARDRLPGPEDAATGVVVRIVGPSTPIRVWRKRRVAGIWTNADLAEIDLAPSFYAVASTRSLFETISHTEDMRHAVSLDRAMRFVGAPAELEGREEFLEAVARLRRRDGLYVTLPGGVEVLEGALFRATIPLPNNLVEGSYAAQVFLTRERAVVDLFATTIEVRKEGLERVITDLARGRPYLYGLLSIAVALIAGLAASEAFRYLRR